MKAYEVYAPEKRTYRDRISGVKVTQLTAYLGHSNHAYFTNNGWWDGGRRLLFCGDRQNASNLFSVEIESGEISRLTDFPAGSGVTPHFTNDVNPKRPEIYYTVGNKIYALDLLTLESRFLYEPQAGFNLHGGLVDADGKYTYAVLMEDLSDRDYANLSASYIGMEETFRADPDCRIIRIDTENGGAETMWQENCWIGHVNPSTTQPGLLTFCHEGPWNLVDHRIWCMDTTTCQPIRLRPRQTDGEMIGHEYWFADGVHVGYQVHRPGEGSWFGVVDYDGKNAKEAPCVPFPSPDHIHSNDFNLIVSDSGNTIKLYRYNGKDFDEARVLCMHDGSFFFGSHHPHPRFTADGRQVLYNSDVSGYCQLYLADVPEDVQALPKL